MRRLVMVLILAFGSLLASTAPASAGWCDDGDPVERATCTVDCAFNVGPGVLPSPGSIVRYCVPDLFE